MASHQLNSSLLGSPENFGFYTQFLEDAVETAESKNVVLYIAGGPNIHATTLYEIIKRVKDQKNLRVVYYFRDNEFEKIISAVNGESKAKRDVEKGSGDEQMTLRDYFWNDRNHEVRLSYCGQDLYFHTKWAAFHQDPISDPSDDVQILLTSANLTFDHLKCTIPEYSHPDTTGSRIVNSMLRFTMSHKEFITQFDNPMNSGPVLCRPVRFGADSTGGRVTQRQLPGNYNDVEIFSQVKHFVDEAIAYSEWSQEDKDKKTKEEKTKEEKRRVEKRKVEFHIVSPFFSDELIIESILSQTQEVRTKDKLKVRIFSKGEPVGLDCLRKDISAINDAKQFLRERQDGHERSSPQDGDKMILKADSIINKHKSGLPYTRNLQKLYDTQGSVISSEYKAALKEAADELNSTDWETNVFRYIGNDFHCKFLAFVDIDSYNVKETQVLMTSANLDTKHMSGYIKKENPSFHNLDWTYRLTGPTGREYDQLMLVPLSLRLHDDDNTAALEERLGKQSLSD